MAMADALVSKVVDALVLNIHQEFRRVAGVKQEVQKLTLHLESIRSVLIEAERRQLKEATVQLWLDRLKSVAYDADDVVDEWSHEILESQIEREKNSQNPARKVFGLLFACYCFPKVISRHHMAVKISDLNARLDIIAIGKDRYGFKSSGENIEQVERIMTTSGILISEVKGREVEKEKLVSMLLDESNERSNVCLIPIAGMGGIGKTTLAKLVFNDERVKSHFHGRIWVCVSDPFDEIRIAKEILQSLQGANSNLTSFPIIMKEIQESFVEGKEYLFVLDDVWNEDSRKWKQLEDCLRGSLSKSRILVTTRNAKVGRIMGCLESDIFWVDVLPEKESWELFCMIAFSRMSSEERASLEEMGKEFVRRCKGLPLAVRTIAGPLQFKKRRTEWQSMLDSELWNMEEFQRDIVAPLWLSYYDLPSPLKQCFLYYAIFPKDHEMEKGELIRCWMAQGYIQGTRSKDLEFISDENFQNLVMRSLFQESRVEQDDQLDVGRTIFKMHDSVHDLAQLLTKRECLSIEVNNDGDTISLDDSLGNSLRHLSVSFRDGTQCLDSFYNLKKLRSLIISWSKSSIFKTSGLDLKKTFNMFTSLRSLRLHAFGIVELPPNINRLIHLRELDLSSNGGLTELPVTVWELYNLQILNLSDCFGIRSIKGLGNLTHLRHLGNSGTNFFLPKEMMRLSGLTRLNMVYIDAKNDEAFSLKHLKNFNQLDGSLEIRWLTHGDGIVEEATQACLQDKKHITRLNLFLGFDECERREKQDKELVEALNVPMHLEILRILYYMDLRAPNLLNSLTVVKMVDLHSWENCEHLPNDLGKLPCLEYLELYKFRKVRMAGPEFLGMDEMMSPSSLSTTVPLFPKLTSLKFSWFDDWEEWNDVKGDEERLIMPSLTSLTLFVCPKLKALPNFILEKTSLKLDIEYCDLLDQSTSS